VKVRERRDALRRKSLGCFAAAYLGPAYLLEVCPQHTKWTELTTHNKSIRCIVWTATVAMTTVVKDARTHLGHELTCEKSTQLRDAFIGHARQRDDLIGCSETRTDPLTCGCSHLSSWTREVAFTNCSSVQFSSGAVNRLWRSWRRGAVVSGVRLSSHEWS